MDPTDRTPGEGFDPLDVGVPTPGAPIGGPLLPDGIPVPAPLRALWPAGGEVTLHCQGMAVRGRSHPSPFELRLITCA